MQIADLSTKYRIRLLWIEVSNGSAMRAVYHAERKVYQKVAKGMDVQLFGEDVGTLGTNTFQVYDFFFDDEYIL